MASRWIRTLLAVPLCFSVLVILLGIASAVVPAGGILTAYLLSLVAPLAAALGMMADPPNAWSGKARGLVVVCGVLRCVLFALNLADTGSYYVWPLDAVLSLVLFILGRRSTRLPSTARVR